jgi:hypothetical protein
MKEEKGNKVRKSVIKGRGKESNKREIEGDRK